jgi:hypothetical protein
MVLRLQRTASAQPWVRNATVQNCPSGSVVERGPLLPLEVTRKGNRYSHDNCALLREYSRVALSHLGSTVLRNASTGVEMAVLVGLVVGFVAAYRRNNLRFGIVLIIPMGVAALEIVVNTARFGVGSMVVWTPILLTLTVAATAAALLGGGWLSDRRHEVP